MKPTNNKQPMRTWIKNPTATWTAGQAQAKNGIVIEDTLIVELVNGEPLFPVDENTVVLFVVSDAVHDVSDIALHFL